MSTPISQQNKNLTTDQTHGEFDPSLTANGSRQKHKGSTLSLVMMMVMSIVFLIAFVVPVTQATRSLEDPLHTNNNVDEWPMNIDGLFAPEQFDNKDAPAAISSSSSSSTHFDFFSPLSAASARERLDSAVEYPEFTVLSTTSISGGARVVLVQNAPPYQVVQGSVMNVNATLQVTDTSGVVVIPSYVGSVALTITVPVAAGTLALNSTAGISFATVTSGEPNITLSGNYAIVQPLLTQLKFTARSIAPPGTYNITYSLTLAGISTTFINTLPVTVSATPTTAPPTTAIPTTAITTTAAATTTAATTTTPTTALVNTTTAPPTSASPTTALPKPPSDVVRIQFSLGSITSITVNSRGWITQQQLLQPHQRFSPLSTVLVAGTAAFNTRLALDICNVTGIAAVYCPQRVVVAETFVQNGQTTAVVDFFPLNTTSLTAGVNSSAVNLTAVAAAAGASLSPTALANLFVQNNQAWSALPTLSGATISTINVYCAASNSYISLTDTCTAPSSSSSDDTWWIVLTVVLGFFFVLAIVIIAVVLVRRQNKQRNDQPIKKVETNDTGKSGALASSSASSSSSSASSGVVTSSPPPVPAPVPITTASSESTGSSGVVVTTPVGNTATAAAADQEFPGVQPGLKFMYSAPDWEPDSEQDGGSGQTGAGGSEQQDVHVDVDEDTRQKRTLKSTLPKKNEDDGNSARFSYVPKEV